jgi:CubicO group peptidase (beta-lactamase class C family)
MPRQYAEENIFKPLGMQQTRYLPAPPTPANMATGYFHEKGCFLQAGTQVPQPLDYDTGFGAVFVPGSSGCDWGNHTPMHCDPKGFQNLQGPRARS